MSLILVRALLVIISEFALFAAIKHEKPVFCLTKGGFFNDIRSFGNG